MIFKLVLVKNSYWPITFILQEKGIGRKSVRLYGLSILQVIVGDTSQTALTFSNFEFQFYIISGDGTIMVPYRHT